MWNEAAANFKISKQVQSDLPSPAVVDTVEEGSIADELGFQPGDKLIKINGQKPRDIIDYQFLISEEEIEIEVLGKEGDFHKIKFEKDTDQNLGISFTEALFDGLNQCNNNCSFCFIDQQPRGNRKTLYLKDDDFRLSFLYGSYLTLTNLSKEDWLRIEKQKLSPLFVSVHATNPNLRSKLLKNPKAIHLINQLDWFSTRKIQIHAQVVVCPGLNDGQFLEETLNELASYGEGNWPVILSTAVVPVGLTRFRPAEDGLIPVDIDCASKTIEQVERLQANYQSKIGSRFAWLSDEWYLIAGKDLPNRASYEELPQQENGVGSIRAFLEAMDIATKTLPRSIKTKRNCSWVVGRLVEEALASICKRLNKVDGLELRLYGLTSPYWGQEQVVTGLLTGKDLLEGLKDKPLGDQLLLPSVMLKQEEPVFLDGMKVNEIEKALDVSIKIVHGADEIVSAALGEIQQSSLRYR